MILFREYHVRPILDGIKDETSKESTFAKVLILKVYPKFLGDFTSEDAWNEGGYTLDELKKVWIEINKIWMPDKMVTRVKFKLVENLRDTK